MMYRKFTFIAVLFTLLANCQSDKKISTKNLDYSDVINELITGEIAYNTTAFVEKYWRVVGNTGFDKSIYYIVEELEKAGYILEEKATFKDILTYRIEKRPLKQPTWESIDASVMIEGESLPLLKHETNTNMLALNSFSTLKEGVTAEVVYIKS